MTDTQNTTLRPAVFLDRDGTIIEDRGHLGDSSQVVFYPDAFDALRRLREHFLLFIVTNQRGIADGLFTRGDVDLVNAHVVDRLAEAGVQIAEVYVCPHRRADECACIKPKPYFLEEAAAAHGIDLRASFSVGDHPHDVLFASGVGASGVYVMTGHGEKHFGELPGDTVVVAGIKEAADHILDAAGADAGQ